MPRYTLESLMAQTGGPSMVEAAGPGPMTAVSRQWRQPYSPGIVERVQTAFTGGSGQALAAPGGTQPGVVPVQPSVLPPVVAPIAAALGAAGITIPPAILAAAGIVGAGYGAYQALGGGEGGGLFGLNILGGDEFTMGGVEFGGPGLAEPTVPYTEWRVGNKQFYYMKVLSPTTGKFLRAKVAMYNRDTRQWKVWTLPKPHLAVIGKNPPSHRMLTRLRHNLRRHTADAKTILQVSSPAYYAKMSGYHKHRRH